MSCRKITYHSIELAQKALDNCIEKGRDEKRFYPCPDCGFYHLTSQIERKNQTMGLLRKATAPPFLKMGLYGKEGCGKTLTAAIIAVKLTWYLTKKLKLDYAPSIAFFETENGSEYIKELVETAGFELFVHKSKAVTDFPKIVAECISEKIPVLIMDSETHLYKEEISAYLRSFERNVKTESGENRTVKRKFMAMADWQPVKDVFSESFSHPFVHAPLNIIKCARAKTVFEDAFNEATQDFKSLAVGSAPRSETESGFEPSILVEMQRAYKEKDEIEKMLKNKNTGAIKGVHNIRAFVVKDRFPDGLTGSMGQFKIDGTVRQKIDTTWKFFFPHIEKLSFGADNLSMPDKVNADEMFGDKEAFIEIRAQKDEKTQLQEEIADSFTIAFPKQNAHFKGLKAQVREYLTGSSSESAFVSSSTAELRTYQRYVKHLANVKKADAESLLDWDAVENELSQVHDLIHNKPAKEETGKENQVSILDEIEEAEKS